MAYRGREDHDRGEDDQMVYVDDFVESIQSLPEEIKRNFDHMRGLDHRSNALMLNVEKNSRNMLKSIKFQQADFDDPKQVELIKRIRKDQTECLQYAEDKVQLAETTFDLVDTHIARLDSQLIAFESELKEKDGGGKGKSQKKRKSDQKAPASVPITSLGWPVQRGWLGQKVSRYWPDEGGWFEAIVTDYKIELGGHKLTYDVGQETESFEWYDLDTPNAGEIEFSILKNLSTVQAPGMAGRSAGKGGKD